MLGESQLGLKLAVTQQLKAKMVSPTLTYLLNSVFKVLP